MVGWGGCDYFLSHIFIYLRDQGHVARGPDEDAVAGVHENNDTSL